MTVYDAHCHVFNGNILIDMIHIPEHKKMEVARVGSDLHHWWGYMKELGMIFVDSEKANNEYLIRKMKEHFPDANAATVPLMMDTHFLLADDLKDGQNIPDGPFDAGHLQNQIDALEKLSSAGNCYPFFAVDPRRTGVIDEILKGHYVTRKPGGFYGVKLYPRLGYHPMSGKLPQLYAYCAANNIPITTHCSAGGFPTWSSPSDAFCDPEGFRPVLEANPTLKINFAHFGNQCPAWGNSIIDLMKMYPGVYSDLSCYTGYSDIEGFKTVFWNQDIVKQRTMYGSDYDIFYFTEAGMDLDDYIQSFQDEFTKDELSNMMTTLPEKFLGI